MEPKIRKPATLIESPVALHSTQSAMGLLHTITAAFMITASEASRCVPEAPVLSGTTYFLKHKSYGRAKRDSPKCSL